MSKTTAEVLREAADLIEPEGAWTQGEWARNASGGATLPQEQDAVCWCASGAIRNAAAGNGALAGPAMYRLARQIDRQAIAEWNDESYRTQQDVVQALRAAADQVEARA